MIGMDEVGRGALAGPLVVCALKLTKPVSGLQDSKKISKNKRNLLYKEISVSADMGIGWASVRYIDLNGISKSLKKASLDALKKISCPLEELIILDGNYNYIPSIYCNVTTLIKADQLILEVSAASIIAKVTRDKYMERISEKVKKYGFDTNVGYGTKKHLEDIDKYGLSGYHRKSFKIKLHAE